MSFDSVKVRANPCVGIWYELVTRPFLVAFYSEGYASKDYSVGVFIELEFLFFSLAFYFELYNLNIPLVGIWLETYLTDRDIPVGFYVETPAETLGCFDRLIGATPTVLPPVDPSNFPNLSSSFIDDIRSKLADFEFGFYSEGFQRLGHSDFDFSSNSVVYVDALVFISAVED